MRCATICATSTGERPNIKPERPDVLLHLHVEGPTALLSVDFSGESLHRRGYRSRRRARAAQGKRGGGRAAARGLAEHRARAAATLLDPMCGSGHLPHRSAR